MYTSSVTTPTMTVWSFSFNLYTIQCVCNLFSHTVFHSTKCLFLVLWRDGFLVCVIRRFFPLVGVRGIAKIPMVDRVGLGVCELVSYRCSLLQLPQYCTIARLESVRRCGVDCGPLLVPKCSTVYPGMTQLQFTNDHQR